jgi:SHS family lactate transporter-like MFS transporter
MSQDSGVPVAEVLRRNWLVLAYLVLLMSAFNFMSHGTQDLYPTLLKVQLGFDPHMILLVSMAGNVGAVLGGMMFGALSERWGRRRTIATAALLGLPVIPLWAFSATLPMLALGAFLMQLMVQGAWGVIPAHLNELSPDAIRGTAPGVTYQLGNLLASYCSIMQAQLAQRWGTTGHPNYSSSLAVVIAGVLVVVAIVSALGHERKGVVFGEAA